VHSFLVQVFLTQLATKSGFKKTWFFSLKKSPTQWGFFGFIGFLDKQEKIGKIIQKLSNLKL